jgi:hypothetical protein
MQPVGPEDYRLVPLLSVSFNRGSRHLRLGVGSAAGHRDRVDVRLRQKAVGTDCQPLN